MSLLPVFVKQVDNAKESVSNTICMLGGFEGDIPPCFDTDVVDAIHDMQKELSKNFPDAISKELVEIGDSQITVKGHIILHIEKSRCFQDLMFKESEVEQICKYFEGQRSTAGVNQVEDIYIIEKKDFPRASLPDCITLFCHRLMSSIINLPGGESAYMFTGVEKAINECHECSILTGFRLYTHVRNAQGDTLIWNCNYSFFKDESFLFNEGKWELDKEGKQKWYEDFRIGYEALCKEIVK